MTISLEDYFMQILKGKKCIIMHHKQYIACKITKFLIF